MLGQVYLGVCMIVLSGCVSQKLTANPPTVEVTQKTVAFSVGETTVGAQERQFGHGSLTMVNLHDDENAAVEAGAAVLQKRGGKLIELTHGGTRRVEFSLRGRDYSFDPNRIFSKAGVRMTVRAADRGTVPEEAHLAVERFAEEFIRHFELNKKAAFIALHNNGDGGLSIHTYEPGGEWAADTDVLHVSTVADPDDVFFVTEERIYEALKAQHFNVVLQDNTIKRDDGSLSVYAGRHGIRYINVEAEPEHLAEQIRMVGVAAEVLNSNYKDGHLR
jgi:hypothetical protein